MSEWNINCEQCGELLPTTAHLAKHLITEHGLGMESAIQEAKAMRQRLADAPEQRIRAAAPDLLKELQTAIAWIEDAETTDPSAPTREQILPQLRAAIKKALP